jgi:uncharacterized membrane-anchored protein YjiN (DUF445 family)
VVYSALTTVLVQTGEFEKVQAVTQQILNMERRSQARSTLVHSLIERGDLIQAQTVIELLEDAKIRAAALRALATALFKVNQSVKALMILGSRTLNEFIEIVSEWGDLVNQLEQGSNREPLSVTVLKRMIKIAKWESPSWREFFDAFFNGDQCSDKAIGSLPVERRLWSGQS